LEDLGAENHDFGSKEMFPKIRELFDEDELEQLGQELELAKGTPQSQTVQHGKQVPRTSADTCSQAGMIISLGWQRTTPHEFDSFRFLTCGQSAN
jgi:hypothetical protein